MSKSFYDQVATAKEIKEARFIEAYDYRDKKGELLSQVCRYDTGNPKKPKIFRQRHLGADGKWIYNIKGIRRVLYRTEKLAQWKKGSIVYIPEGEKDVHTLEAFDFQTVTWPMGALNWKNEYSEQLQDFNIVLIPDNDKESRAGINKVGISLQGKAASIKIIKLPGLEKGEDISDWAGIEGNTKEKFLKLERKEFEPVPVKKKKKESSTEGFNPKEFMPTPCARAIKRAYQVIYDKQKRLWYYDKEAGIWKDDFEPLCRSILRKGILASAKTNKYENEVIYALKDLSYQENIPDEPDFRYIAFNNGIYDMKKQKLLDFDSKYFFINKLGINYNSDTEECPNIDKLFNELVAEEDVVTLYEIISYCYLRLYPYPKCFFLYGNGANGKSTFCQVVRKVIGNDNISSTSLNTLQYNTFGTSALYGRLVNVSPEMSYNILKKTDILKQLTGSDLVRGEKKFRDEFNFVNYSKLIFLGNEIPYSEDKSFAFYRRMFLIEFANRFEIKIKADPFIVERIPEKEFEALGYKCLKILRSLSEENFTFTRHKRTEEIAEEYERISDPLGVFIDEFTESSPDDNIPVLSLNQEFKKYQKEKGLRIWNDKLISKSMSQKGYIKRTLRLSTSAKGDYTIFKAYLEIKWRIKSS